MANWVPVKILGEGSYGVVFLAEPKTGSLDNTKFAVKVTHLHNHSSISNEEKILQNFIGCPEIVQCLGSEITIQRTDSYSPMAFYILKLEYAAGGTLADLIRRRTKLPESEVKEYLRMILRGLSCIHRKGFVHVDLKPENILVFPESDGRVRLKIADFGLSRRSGEMDEEGATASFRGTPRYMSPESVVFSEVKSALDIWSLGCVVVKMVSGRSAWSECKSAGELTRRLLEEMEIPEIPEELCEEGKDFVRRCFERRYERRWTAEMLLQHPYVCEEKGAVKKGYDMAQLLPHLLYGIKSNL